LQQAYIIKAAVKLNDFSWRLIWTVLWYEHVKIKCRSSKVGYNGVNNFANMW